MAAALDQDAIGWMNFIKGRISLEWLAQSHFYASIGSSCTSRWWAEELVQNLLAMVHKMWIAHNDVAHAIDEKGCKIKMDLPWMLISMSNSCWDMRTWCAATSTWSKLVDHQRSAGKQWAWLHSIQQAHKIGLKEFATETMQMQNSLIWIGYMPQATTPNTNTNSLWQHTMMKSANYLILQSEQQIQKWNQKGHQIRTRDWKQNLKKDIKSEQQNRKWNWNQKGHRKQNRKWNNKSEQWNWYHQWWCPQTASWSSFVKWMQNGPHSGTYGLHLCKPRSFAHQHPDTSLLLNAAKLSHMQWTLPILPSRVFTLARMESV